MKSRTDETLKYVQFLARHFDRLDVNALTLAILYDLGFTSGNDGFLYLRQAIEFQYAHAASVFTTTVYLRISRIHNAGESWEFVEKAIHRAIVAAWEIGDSELWNLFFPPRRGRAQNCPPNKEFIARISCIIELWQSCKEAAYEREI